jgi:hypothetical protein
VALGAFTPRRHRETFDPTHEKDIDADQLANLRRFLRTAGYGPEGQL